MFSSDDSRESVDITNYQSPRIFKNKREGAWWDNGEPSTGASGTKKTKMSRNYDSGVYMMSDATDSSDSLLPPQRAPFSLPSEDLSTADLLPQKLDDDDYVFNSILQHGLEKNAQDYDFSNLDLKDSQIRQIGQLASVILNIPDPGDDIPTEGQYRSMVAEVNVNLRSNQLCRLTSSLFHVHNLTTLILENNQIQELPAQFGQLRNLRYLNLSRNPIRWLPHEMLQLFRPRGVLHVIADLGVNWLEPELEQDASFRQLDSQILDFLFGVKLLRDEAILDHAHACLEKVFNSVKGDDRNQHMMWHLRFIEMRIKAFARHILEKGNLADIHEIDFAQTQLPSIPVNMASTPITYYDQSGTVMKGSPGPIDLGSAACAAMTQTDHGVHGVPPEWYSPPSFKMVNSLATMALSRALRYTIQEGLDVAWLKDQIGEPVPQHAEAVLSIADKNASGGYSKFRACHKCEKEYVVPRAEWIEWWYRPDTKTFPFKVEVCSWGCVPEPMRERPEKEFSWD